jgi:hypothetical protein
MGKKNGRISTGSPKLEKGKLEPDEGVINHWEREIEAFTIRVRRLEDRLARQRRRGR